MSLGSRLAELRRQKNQSLQQVADAVGVSKAHIWQLEREVTNNPSRSVLIGLANHFGVTVASLMGESLDANDADPQLVAMFRQAQQLNARERQILDDMLQTLLRNRPEPNVAQS